MATTNLIPAVLRTLSRDGWLLFVTRFARLFAYGSLSVILVFYLAGLGLTEAQTGLVLTLTLVGDVVISLYLTTRADRIGRRRMLVVGSILMAAAGLAFACTNKLRSRILSRQRLAPRFLRGTRSPVRWRPRSVRSVAAA